MVMSARSEATAEELTTALSKECANVARVSIEPRPGGHEYTAEFTDGSEPVRVRVLDGGDKSAANVAYMLASSIESRAKVPKA